jgi:hypothetical protein
MRVLKSVSSAICFRPLDRKLVSPVKQHLSLRRRRELNRESDVPSVYLPAHLKEWYYWIHSSCLFFRDKSARAYTHTRTHTRTHAHTHFLAVEWKKSQLQLLWNTLFHYSTPCRTLFHLDRLPLYPFTCNFSTNFKASIAISLLHNSFLPWSRVPLNFYITVYIL